MAIADHIVDMGPGAGKEGGTVVFEGTVRGAKEIGHQGACPACEGLGVIYTDLQHMDPVATRCEACKGRCFTDEVLALKLRGKDINDVHSLSVPMVVGVFGTGTPRL
jgi:excinuclease UvrABC ATPase subunit